MKKIVLIFTLILVLASSAFAQSQPIDAGLGYLTSSQNADRSWGVVTGAAGTVASTVAVLETLQLLDKRDLYEYAGAVAWLQSQDLDTTEHLSERMLVFNSAGSDLAKLLAYIDSLRNAWGGYNEYGVNIIDTVYAIRALKAINHPDTSVFASAVGFLIYYQNTDGGWGYAPGMPSNTFMTSLVSATLQQFTGSLNVAAPISTATTYLLNHQNAADGGFGSSPSTVQETAMAYKALSGVISDSTVLGNGIAYLTATQHPGNGSWNNDPYATALALQALVSVAPNLSISAADVSYGPSQPVEGDAVTLSATVHNASSGSVQSVKVWFHDGDPNADGQFIAERIIAGIPSQGSVTVSSPWTPAGSGTHAIYVTVDPENSITESGKSDNLAVKQVPVYAKVDLTIDKIAFVPDMPAPGQSVDAEVKVKNAGGLPADQVLVRLSVDGVQFGEKTIGSLPGFQIRTVSFSIPNLATAAHQVAASVDPLNAIAEADEANNTSSASVELRDRIDLMVANAGIYTSQSAVMDGETVRIAARVYNLRESEARDVLVRIYEGDPAGSGTQIGADQIVTVPGLGSALTGWIDFPTLGKSGGHGLIVVADPLNEVIETEKGNNRAVSSFYVTPRADLIVQDILFSPESPQEGDPVTVSARIKNIGSAASTNAVKVLLYLGDPAAGGQQVGTDRVVPAINPDSTSDTSPFQITTTGMLGGNQFYAVIDPSGALDEINKSNNSLEKTLTVQAYTRPDLSITSSDITFSPDLPTSGETLSLTAVVHNLREAAATDVQVNFYDGNPAAGGLLIGSATIASVPALGSAAASAAWDLTGVSGTHAVYAKAATTSETQVSNNIASASVKIRLPQGVAPINLIATAATATAIDLAWQPGPDAAAYGIISYKVYRNDAWANYLRNIESQGTASASSVKGSINAAAMAIDGSIATSWYPATNATLPVWWREDFTQAGLVKKIAVSWSAPPKNYEVQTWDGSQWTTQASVTSNTKYVTVHEFASPVLTTAVRLYVTTGSSTATPCAIYEVKVYEDWTNAPNTWQDAGLAPGTYGYFVTAVDQSGAESLPSNTAYASLGDTTAPAPPTGFVTAVDGQTVTANWSANTEEDLAGYRVFRDGLNVARRERGALITATLGDRPEYVIDGQSSSLGCSAWGATPPGSFTITLARTYPITGIRMQLDESGCKYSRYLIEASPDGMNWQTVVDRTSGNWQGTLEMTPAEPLLAGSFRITGLYCSNSNFFNIAEFEAYTSERAPLTLDTYTTYAVAPNYYNLTETKTDLLLNDRQPRQFIFSRFDLEEKDLLNIYDKDTNLLLASYSGKRDAFITQPLIAANYRFVFITDCDGTASGYTIEAYTTRNRLSATTFTENIIQNGTYRYAVSAVDTSGNESDPALPAAAVVADIVPPAIPGNLAAAAGTGVVNLSWTLNGEADFAGYNLYRNGDPTPLNGAKLIKTGSYEDKQVVNLTTYTYRITGVDTNGNESAQSSPVTAVPTGADLSITASDISFRPRFPSVFDDITVYATIHNISTDALDVPVQATLYLGDPASGGVPIATSAIPAVAANDVALVEFTWNPTGFTGSNTLYLVVDAAHALPELDKTNNSASFMITVNPEPALTMKISSVDTVNYPEISANVRVGDWAGDGIFNLTADNFTATEDGTGQSPLSATLLNSSGHKPMADIVFVFDNTGSMGTVLNNLKLKTSDFISKLAASNIDYLLGLVTFMDDVTVRNGGYLTGNDSTFISWVNGLEALPGSGGDGPENSLDALEKATMMHFRPGAQKAFILITDEQPHTMGDGTLFSHNTLTTIEQELQEAGAPTYIVGPTTVYGKIVVGPPAVWGDVSMQGIYYGDGSIPQATNGKFYDITDDFSSIVDDFAASIARMMADYRITYTTGNPARDGTLRNVTVDATYRGVSGSARGEYRAPSLTQADLVLGTLTFSNDAPVNNETVTLSADIRNLGGIDAANVLVRFFDGDPAAGLQLGADQVIPLIPPAGTAAASSTWRASAGTRRITVVVDPLNTIPESSEENNKTVRSVTVPGMSLPQLGIHDNDIAFSKTALIKGDRLAMSATVHNSGEGATDVLVAVFIGDPRSNGVQIGTSVIPYLGPSESTMISADWVIDQPAGAYDVYFWVDPFSTVPEDNKADNIAKRQAVIDQKTLSLSVTTDKASYEHDMNAAIRIAVRNDSSAFWTGTGAIAIEDANGAVVEQVASFPVTGLAPSGLGGWAYRIPAPVTAERNMKNMPAQAVVDFGAALAQVGAPDAIVDMNSIRVLEFDASGGMVGEKNARATFTSSTAAGIVWLMDGITNSGTTRSFFIYFDTTDHGAKQPSLKNTLPLSGKLIAFTDDAGKIFVAESYGDGTFGAPRQIDALTGSGLVRGIALDDFNGDGFLDIVTGSAQAGALYLYLNKADGTDTFNTKVQVGTIASMSGFFTDMVSADFNDDGKKDFVASGSSAVALYLFTGNGDGTFVRTNLTVPANAFFRGKTAADVNSDGFIDLIASATNGYIYLYMNKGNGTFDPPVQIGSLSSTEAHGLAAGDFNGDGKVDILANKANLGDAYLFSGAGNGTFAQPVLVPSLDTNNSAGLDLGDFNNDGRLDIIAAVNTAKKVEFYPGNGDGTFGTSTLIASTANASLGISASPALAEVRVPAGTAEPVTSWSTIITWNTGSTAAGDYRVRATATEGEGILAENTVSFAIVPDKTASASVLADKTAYDSNETVALTSTVTSRSANFIFENLTATLSIGSGDPSGTLYTDAKTITALPAGGTYRFSSYWNTGTIAPGMYPVSLIIADPTGSVIASAAWDLVISSSVKPSSSLRGLISVEKQSLMSGETTTVSYDVANIGNADLQNVTLSVAVVHVVSQSVYDTLTTQATLSMGGSYANTGLIDTAGYSAKDYLVILRAALNGVEETLASTYFRVEGAPSAPSLAGPLQGSDVLTFTPSLSVNNASDPNDDRLTYEFEIYSDPALSSLVASGTSAEGSGTTIWSTTTELMENATYFWRARAYDGKLYGPWMETATFRVNTANDAPSAPVPTAPANTADVSVLNPVLTVTNAADPDSSDLTYNFVIALDPEFIQIAASETGIAAGAGSTSWQVPLNLSENSTYYWRAQADDWLITGPWSAPFSFFVNTENDAPSAPVITAPVDGSTVAALAADITVANSIDPDSAVITYFYEIDTVMTFDSRNIIRSGGILQGQETTTWCVEGLTDNTRYYVRVKASDGAAESAWSSAASFFANLGNDAPTAPVLANPSNGAGVNVFTPALSVQNSTDLDHDVLTYEFELYGDEALATLVSNAASIAETARITSWTVPVALSENQTYYWRARAYDGTAVSEWMPAASFMINIANDAPGAPRLSAPAQGSGVSTLTPVLAVVNAIDPDSDTLVYEFEVSANGAVIQTRTGVPQDNSGITSITLDTIADNTVYTWRVRAFDGDRYGAWMDSATFTVHIQQTSINATIDFDPDTLNKTSKGTWVVVYIELPAGYKPSDVDISSIRMEGMIPAEVKPHAIGDNDKDGIPDLMVKFKRSDVINALPVGDRVTVHVAGKVGTFTFEGADIIRVIP